MASNHANLYYQNALLSWIIQYIGKLEIIYKLTLNMEATDSLTD